MNTNQTLKEKGGATVCPSCKRTTDYRIKRNRLVRFCSLVFPIKRFWCPNCQKRFYVRH